MHCTRKITENIHWIGGSDRRLARFENQFPIPNGVTYNSYVILDDKTAVLDTIDSSLSKQFFENIAEVLCARKLDYLVINHMEPDHCANIENLIFRYPDVKIVGNARTIQMIGQFFDFDLADRTITVAENDQLSLGKHTLEFIMAPMVHWPEAMVSYEVNEKILFSADAFGTFGALGGTIFNDEMNFDRDWLDDARRYYTNIVGKYGNQVQLLLKKASKLDIKTICPLHGPIWRTNLEYIIGKYDIWSKYETEEKGILIAYASMYGNTENAANALSVKLADLGVSNMKVCDISSIDVSYLISDVFKYSHIVLASPTYNGGLYPAMEELLSHIKALSVQNKTFAVIENGSWASVAGRFIKETISSLKNSTLIDSDVTIKSSIKKDQEEKLMNLAKIIKSDF